MRNILRPVMRYHGGKWKLGPWIISHFPEHQVYVEPYGGAASVLMQKPRSYAEVYNDLDSEIVNVFRVLRDSSAAVELERLIRLTPFSHDEFDCSYIPNENPIEQARRTIFRTFAGYGSDGHTNQTGFRHNTTRAHSIPAHDWACYPDNIRMFCERLQGVVIENMAADRVILAHDSQETLHYIDPPYVKASRSDDGDDYRFEMNDDQHSELAKLLHNVSGMVILSGYRCELYDDLYHDWKSETKSAWASGAKERTETLWCSPNIKSVGFWA